LRRLVKLVRGYGALLCGEGLADGAGALQGNSDGYARGCREQCIELVVDNSTAIGGHLRHELRVHILADLRYRFSCD
jgi:hypothetical protein